MSMKSSNRPSEELNELTVVNVVCHAIRAYIEIYIVDVAYLAPFSEGKKFRIKTNLCFIHMPVLQSGPMKYLPKDPIVRISEHLPQLSDRSCPERLDYRKQKRCTDGERHEHLPYHHQFRFWGSISFPRFCSSLP